MEKPIRLFPAWTALVALLALPACVSPIVVSSDAVHVGVFYLHEESPTSGRRDHHLQGVGLTLGLRHLGLGYLNATSVTITDPSESHRVRIGNLTVHTGPLAESLELIRDFHPKKP